jgi:hypothetical protein
MISGNLFIAMSLRKPRAFVPVRLANQSYHHHVIAKLCEAIPARAQNGDCFAERSGANATRKVSGLAMTLF